MSLFLFHFLAFFFSSPLLRPLLLFFFNSPLLPSLSISLPLSSSSMVLRCVLACMHDRGKWKNLHGSVSGLDPNIHLLFSPFFLLYLFCADTCQDGKSSLSLVWQYPCSVYSKCFNPYGQKLFICIYNSGIVNQKTVQFLMFVSIKLWFNLNM